MMQAMSLFLGLIVIVISLATFVTGMMPAQILDWGLEMLGGVFLLLLSALVITAMFCCVRSYIIGHLAVCFVGESFRSESEIGTYRWLSPDIGQLWTSRLKKNITL